jgi:protease secretion system outer membrane protein
MMLPRSLARLGAVALVWAAAGAAQAFSFGQAYEAALANDPQMQAARHERESVQQGVPIARASLLPNVSLSMSHSKVHGAKEFPNALNQTVRQDLDYSAPSRSLSMRMPLFNYESLSRYRQALSQYDYADLVYSVRSSDLVDRLGGAYLQFLLSEENLRLGQAQVKALEVQRARAQRMMQMGESTRIEVAEADAALDVARVQVIEAQDALEVARRTLKRITGVEPASLNNVALDFRPGPLMPERLSDWQELAEQRNPNVRARVQAVESARLGIHRNRAGHLPRLDLVASASVSRNESLSTLSQESRLHSLGLQLNVPIYSGGGVEASVRQAIADRDRAAAELDAEKETVAIEVQRQFQSVSNGAARIDAYRKALESSQTALEGTEKALKAGYRTLADVLDAQSKVYLAQRDLAQARYEYLHARLRLHLQTGAALPDVVSDIDGLLTVVAAPR